MATKLSAGKLLEALETLGAVLEAKKEHYQLALIGGGALLLLGLIDRPTQDLDAVAIIEEGSWGSARPFPASLQAAIREVASALDLADNWLNSGAAMVLRTGLPEGFEDRVKVRRYGGLIVHLASRRDQIALKLDAAADNWPDQGRHLMDLRSLEPAGEELVAARAWCCAHRSADRMRPVDEVMTYLLMGGNDAWV